MDRTNWQLGHKAINLLTFAIITGKVASPIVWMVLPLRRRQGNSNAAQRIGLMSKLLALTTTADILALIMDRQFIGKKWLHCLH